DHRHLRFEVEAPLRIGKGDVLGRSEEVARSSLVDEGIFPQRRRRLGAARLAHENHVVEEGRAVHPLVRAGKRSVEAVGLDGQAFHPPRLQVGGEGLEPGRHIVPTIEGGLEVRRDAVGRRVDRVLPAHHDELSVAASIPERSEFHPLPPPAIAPSKANGVMTRSMKGTPPTNASTSAASARPVVKPCVQRRATTRTAHSQMKAMNPVPGRMPTSPGAEAYAAVRKVRENAGVVDPTIRQATCSSAAKPQMPPTVSERAKSHLTTGETSAGSSGSGTNWPQPGKNSPTVSAHNQETTKPARETRRAKREAGPTCGYGASRWKKRGGERLAPTQAWPKARKLPSSPRRSRGASSSPGSCTSDGPAGSSSATQRPSGWVEVCSQGPTPGGSSRASEGFHSDFTAVSGISISAPQRGQ